MTSMTSTINNFKLTSSTKSNINILWIIHLLALFINLEECILVLHMYLFIGNSLFVINNKAAINRNE